MSTAKHLHIETLLLATRKCGNIVLQLCRSVLQVSTPQWRHPLPRELDSTACSSTTCWKAAFTYAKKWRNLDTLRSPVANCRQYIKTTKE